MTREGWSLSHESPSYKVHNHHIQTDINTHMSCTMQPHRVKK